jgi:hypothetical protein
MASNNIQGVPSLIEPENNRSNQRFGSRGTNQLPSKAIITVDDSIEIWPASSVPESIEIPFFQNCQDSQFQEFKSKNSKRGDRPPIGRAFGAYGVGHHIDPDERA